MNSNIPFQTIDWSKIEKTIHPGETGTAFWQTAQFPGRESELWSTPQVTWPITGAAKAILCIVWKANSPANQSTGTTRTSRLA